MSAKCKRKLKGYVNRTVELDDLPDAVMSKEDDVAGRVDLQNAFARLDDRERQVIAMSVLAGYDGETIAKLMKMNHNTVRTVKSRALEKLRKLLA